MTGSTEPHALNHRLVPRDVDRWHARRVLGVTRELQTRRSQPAYDLVRMHRKLCVALFTACTRSVREAANIRLHALEEAAARLGIDLLAGE